MLHLHKAIGVCRPRVLAFTASRHRQQRTRSVSRRGVTSRSQFKDFLAAEVIQQTTCPPYVHSLNGVAERAIRSIMENARAHLIASGAPISFWPYAVEHAVDILNRSTCPPDSDRSSFELVHGQKPKLLPIQPFGCRAVVVRPRHSYSKTQIDAHGETGVNLGKSLSVTNGYRIWIPTRGKIVTASDVYFDATFMPWRPDGDRRVGPAVPSASPSDDPPAFSPPLAHEVADRPSSPTHIESTFDQATRGPHALARESRRVLVLFSGPYRRPDSLASFLHTLGYDPLHR